MNTTITNDLSSLPEKALLDDTAVASLFKISTRTVKRWAANGQLPAPAKLGGRRFWFAGRILLHIESQLAESEKAAARRKCATMRAQTP